MRWRATRGTLQPRKGRAAAKVIRNALLLRCASRCRVERIYTFNFGDFKQLAPASLEAILCAPEREVFQPTAISSKA